MNSIALELHRILQSARDWFRASRIGLVIFLVLLAPSLSAETLLTSPDGRLRLSLSFPRVGSTNTPQWSVRFRGQPLLTDSGFGLRTQEDGELLAGARPLRKESRAVNETLVVPFGRSAYATNRFHELRLLLENDRRGRIDLVLRCYNDAVAFRYELPATGKSSEPVVVVEETSSFRVAGNPQAYSQSLENFRTSHEHNVAVGPARDLPTGTLLDLPLTFSGADGHYFAITEAALRHYAGMALRRAPTPHSEVRLVSELTPRSDGNRVVGTRPLLTPWRVVLVGDRPGALLESETLFCLNAPSVIPDLSWIHPGKITFSWWNGDVFDGQRGDPILSLKMAKKYIDFCASNDIPTHSLTSTETTVTPWYHQSKPGVEPGPDTDVTRPREGFDLPGIRAYAEARGVRLWTWVHQGALRGRVEEAFTAFERMGWSGMMVDFFDHDDQDSVEFAESVLAAAARHHILIHLHGVWKPTGLERTYPNLMNHEGALNLEYLKWSDRCTPQHDVLMAYTRLIAGPMDYHLGGFRAVPRAEFVAKNVAPNVLGTRAHQLALYVCFDNPNPMVADYPMAYEGQEGFDFIRRVPTWWDETRIIDGRVGEFLVTARRKGNVWYLGGISAGPARSIHLPLRFLGPGRYHVRVWSDTPDASTQPNALHMETRTVSGKDRLNIQLGLDGGFVAELVPDGP